MKIISQKKQAIVIQRFYRGRLGRKAARRLRAEAGVRGKKLALHEVFNDRILMTRMVLDIMRTPSENHISSPYMK